MPNRRNADMWIPMADIRAEAAACRFPARQNPHLTANLLLHSTHLF